MGVLDLKTAEMYKATRNYRLLSCANDRMNPGFRTNTSPSHIYVVGMYTMKGLTFKNIGSVKKDIAAIQFAYLLPNIWPYQLDQIDI